MSAVCDGWLASGPPDPEHYDSLEDYLAHEFGRSMDALELILVLGGLGGSLEHVRDAVRHGAESALHAVGAEITEGNCFAASKVLCTAKREAIDDYRQQIERPGQAIHRTGWVERATIPDECAPYAVSAEWPHNLLVQLDHSGWPVDCRISGASGPPAASTTAATESALGDWETITILEAAERYILAHPKTGASEAGPDDKRVTWNNDTLRQFRAAVMVAGKACPGPISQIRHDDIARLSNIYGRLPSNHHKSPRHETMTLEEIIEEAVQLRAAGRLKAGTGLGISTINRHVRYLKELFDWGAKNVPMAEIRWSEFTSADRRDKRGLRAKLEVEQAHELFLLPIWTGCLSAAKRFKAGSEIFHDAGYWVLLILWYSGMRLTECCKLMLDEIGQEDGIWYILIEENENGKLKTEASKRKFPMHSELIRLGLPDFVAALRKRGERSLFPELLQGLTAPGKTWYTRFGQYLKGNLSFLKPLMGGHSMRHSVESELKKVRVHEELRNDLLGRVNRSEGAGRYGKALDATEFVDIVEKIPVATAHLTRRPIRLLPRCTPHPVPRAPRKQNQPRRVGPRPGHAPASGANRPDKTSAAKSAPSGKRR
jgi:integrase